MQNMFIQVGFVHGKRPKTNWFESWMDCVCLRMVLTSHHVKVYRVFETCDTTKVLIRGSSETIPERGDLWIPMVTYSL